MQCNYYHPDLFSADSSVTTCDSIPNFICLEAALKEMDVEKCLIVMRLSQKQFLATTAKKAKNATI